MNSNQNGREQEGGTVMAFCCCVVVVGEIFGKNEKFWRRGEE
jgi:hypothetical protein